MLETERLIIRPWQKSDVAYWKAMAMDVGYNVFAPPGSYAVKDNAAAEQKIGARIKLFDEARIGKMPVFEKRCGAFVGTCGGDFFPHNGTEEVELGYRLMLDHWGKGYATEAAKAMLDYLLDDVELRRVYAFVHAKNPQSIRVLEKAGFNYVNEFVWLGLPHKLYRVQKTR